MRFKQNGTELKSPTRSALLKKFTDAFSERPIEPIEVEPSILRRWTRRDLLLFGAGALATLAVGGSQLPREVLRRLGLAQGETTGPENQWLLNKAQRLDDDVSATLYSKHHLVPTYTKSQITPLKNNYNGTTPDPAYIPGWRLTLDGLSSSLAVSLDIRALLAHQIHDQITRLVCVEGWSAIAWWSGLRFDDLLHAYPPVSQAKWAYIESSVNLDANGNPDPYFVSIDC
jgi:DMSO/TMAO reductase YedYZ molybdopterin-dependent catalytic subunit